MKHLTRNANPKLRVKRVCVNNQCDVFRLSQNDHPPTCGENDVTLRAFPRFPPEVHEEVRIVRAWTVMHDEVVYLCTLYPPSTQGLWSRFSNFRIRFQFRGSKFFGTGSSICKFLVPAPEQFGPKYQRNIVLFV